MEWTVDLSVFTFFTVHCPPVVTVNNCNIKLNVLTNELMVVIKYMNDTMYNKFLVCINIVSIFQIVPITGTCGSLFNLLEMFIPTSQQTC